VPQHSFFVEDQSNLVSECRLLTALIFWLIAER
jgi:hypothetical protein